MCLVSVLLAGLLRSSAAPEAVAAAAQLVVNGGFEAGTTGWAPSSVQGRALTSGAGARSGSAGADLCGGDLCNDNLEQGIRVPANVVSATLRFSLRLDSSEPATSHCFDATGIGIFDALQNQIFSESFCNTTADSTFREEVRDVTSALAGRDGQTLTLALGSDTDASYPSRAFWDNIRLDVMIAAPPAAAANVHAFASAPGEAVVTWSAPADVTPAITSYEVVASNGARQTVDGSARRARFSGLPTAQSVTFTVTAVNGRGVGASTTSNAVRPSQAAELSTATSDRQYRLTSSDGATWQPLDAQNLSLSVAPGAAGNLWLTANADLWTANAGVNQDLGIRVNGKVVAWKESGGFAGTFSPNAVAVTALVPIGTAGALVELVWKTNVPASGMSIFAGAGPIAGNFSPTRLSAERMPDGGPVRALSAVSTGQAVLSGSDGSTWTDMGVSVPVPASSGSTTLFASADLWTQTAGINQDLGIMETTSDGSVVNQLVGWKESGGFAGTYSPNAAMVLAVVPARAVASTFRLVWKANKPTTGTIVAGAGTAGAFSPTTLTALTSASGAVVSTASQQQYLLQDSDGATWKPLGGSELTTTVTPAVNSLASITASVDLWTQQAGYNQDVGIRVVPVAGPESVAWKESGGSAGTFSPNAAAVMATVPMTAGQTYTVSLLWKANRLSPKATIMAGAGSSPSFSPTRLAVALVPVPS